ncbi:MAG TPA: serine protease [Planctomycetota bacterium]|nr:serine protease [Planctomycetota bacterium]
MVKRLIVYGLLGMALAIVLSTQYKVDRPDAEMVIIVKAPEKPRHPYQEEHERMLYPVVRITSDSGTGSGVIIATTDFAIAVSAEFTDEHRWIQIITAAHVVEDQSVVDIELYDSTIITGTVVITDTVKDLALIKPEINTDKIYKARLAPGNYEAYLFSPVWTIGCSLGLEPRPSYGHITHIEKSNQCLSVSICGYEISAPILPGNSGGPVYDARTYEVIGIAVWVKVYAGQLVTTMAGVVPINEIYEFLDSHTFVTLSVNSDAEVAEK